jgi:hypothetical protein
MAIKKKVTYSVSYTAGTDTLTEKLNSLLQDIVTLILSQNTGLTVLDTITVGSTRWTGAPLFDTYVSGLQSDLFNNRHYQSDVIFIGTNEDNVCLSLGFFENNLVVAMNMTPKVEKEYTDNWSALGGGTYVKMYAIGKSSRWFSDVANMLGNYAIPYSVVNNTISMSIIYWDSEYSRGYYFVNESGQSDGVDLVIFNTDEGNNQTGLGAAIWPYGTANAYRAGISTIISIFSFNENLSDNKPQSLMTISNTGETYMDSAVPDIPTRQLLNSRQDWRRWYNCNNSSAPLSYKYFACVHVLGASNGKINSKTSAPTDQLKINSTWDCPTPAPFISPLVAAYNLPHLNEGQAYVRKMRIPGWNPNCKGEIYLLWSPVTAAYKSGDIVEVGSKSYAIITEGAVVWAARVS